MKPLHFTLNLFILLVLVSCTKTAEVEPEDALSKQEKIWKDQGITDYEFTLQITCFCIYEYTLPKQIVVRNNEIQTVNGIDYSTLEFETYMTLDEFFDYIRERQSQNPVVEELTFDPEYGFPTYIYFDISKMIADEEVGYTISEFKAN